MNKHVAIAAVVLSFAPGLALAGEGNGPDFPGLQVPNISVGVSTQPGSTDGVSETTSHRADSEYEPSSSFPSPTAPDGIVRPTPNQASTLHDSEAASARAPHR